MVAREVFVCKCATDVVLPAPAADDVNVRWLRGREEHLALLSPEDHRPHQLADLRARLRRGEHWLLGLEDDRVVSYTWLHTRDVIDFPYLPGCTFRVAADVGYGYDAWTPPLLRGRGLRRRGFLEELHVLGRLGMRWEASFFVKDQLEGARRSLGSVGIEIVPLWRVHLDRDKTLAIERIAEGDDSVVPLHPGA
jgi:hypothetical protein